MRPRSPTGSKPSAASAPRWSRPTSLAAAPVGDTAWKLKPLTLPFLDYGTARAAAALLRRAAPQPRFAPGLYLGLDAVDDTGEWAVRMRRFPETSASTTSAPAAGSAWAALSSSPGWSSPSTRQRSPAGDAFGEPAEVLARPSTTSLPCAPSCRARQRLGGLDRPVRASAALCRPQGRRPSADATATCTWAAWCSSTARSAFDCIVEFGDRCAGSTSPPSSPSPTWISSTTGAPTWPPGCSTPGCESGDFQALPVLRSTAFTKPWCGPRSPRWVAPAPGPRLPGPRRIHRHPAAAPADDHLRAVRLGQEHQAAPAAVRPVCHDPAPALRRRTQAPPRPRPSSAATRHRPAASTLPKATRPPTPCSTPPPDGARRGLVGGRRCGLPQAPRAGQLRALAAGARAGFAIRLQRPAPRMRHRLETRLHDASEATVDVLDASSTGSNPGRRRSSPLCIPMLDPEQGRFRPRGVKLDDPSRFVGFIRCSAPSPPLPAPAARRPAADPRCRHRPPARALR